MQTKTKEYIRPIPATWWLKRRTYTLFMIRELTAVFVGAYAVFLLVLVARAQNAQSFAAFVEALKCPLSIALHMIALPMAVYHSVTWFNLTPKAVVLWRGEEKVSPMIIAGANYVVWAVASLLILWIVLKAG